MVELLYNGNIDLLLHEDHRGKLQGVGVLFRLPHAPHSLKLQYLVYFASSLIPLLVEHDLLYCFCYRRKNYRP